MRITLSHLTNSILGSLADQAITTSRKPQYNVVTNNPLLSTLDTEYTGFIAVFGKQAFSGMGTSVEKADMLRDGAFGGMKTILQGYIKLPGFEYQQDAIDLFSIFQQRGLGLNTFSYADQSTEMDKLISELSKPENRVKLERLHMGNHFETMRTAEADFKNIFSEQLGANASLRMTQSASSTRHNLEAALRNYFGVVEGMKNIIGWKELHTELSELVKTIRNSKQEAKQIDTTAPVL
jgi:hypothetical protein